MAEPKTERRERASNAMRQEILHAAEQLLNAEGIDALSLRKIAGALDYSAPSLYYYYPDKESVLDALAARHAAQMLPLLERAATTEPRDPVARLRAISLAYVEWGLDNPMPYVALFRIRTEHERIREALRPILDVFIRPIGDGQRVGRLRRDTHPDQMSYALWTGLHGFVALTIALPGLSEGKRSEAVPFQVDTLLRGLRGP